MDSSQVELRQHFRQFCEDHDIKVLNVAGSRESAKAPIHKDACDWIIAALIFR